MALPPDQVRMIVDELEGLAPAFWKAWLDTLDDALLKADEQGRDDTAAVFRESILRRVTVGLLGVTLRP